MRANEAHVRALRALADGAGRISDSGSKAAMALAEVCGGGPPAPATEAEAALRSEGAPPPYVAPSDRAADADGALLCVVGSDRGMGWPGFGECISSLFVYFVKSVDGFTNSK